MQRFAPLSLIAVLLAGPAAAGCPPLQIAHQKVGSPAGGGFDLAGTGLEKAEAELPDVRFWAYKEFDRANSGTKAQRSAEGAWLVRPEKLGLKPAPVAVLAQADWYGDEIKGCVLETESRRTVVELTFSDPAREGSKDHQGYFAVISMPYGEDSTSFDADAVRGGKGNGSLVPVAPIPVPRITEVAPAAAGRQSVTVELPEAPSYSEGGKDAPVKLIAGYRLLYAGGAEPTSSDPAKYKPAGEAVLKPGKSTVELPADAQWVVAQLVFADPSPLYSRATSGHVALQAGAGGGTASGGRTRTRSRSDSH